MTYRFNKPVALGSHRLMLRPRESRDLRLISSNVTVAPESVLTWAHGTPARCSRLACLQHRRLRNCLPVPVFRRRMDRSRRFDETAIPGPTGRLSDWARAFVRGQSTDTLSLLKDLSAGVTSWISAIRAGMTRALSLQPRLWIAAGDRVGISRCSLRTRCAASGSARVSSLAISTIPIRNTSDRVMRDRRRLDHFRSDQSRRWRLQSHTRRRRTRHPAGDSSVRQFRRDD
jgi:hypothetical protein